MNQEKKSVPIDKEPPAVCPAPEKISAFLDGEEVFTPEEEAHFYSCVECQRLFRSYKNMGILLEDALKEEMKKLPGSERILAKVHEKLHKEYGVPLPEEEKGAVGTFSFVPLRYMAGAAAVFLFFVFAFLLVMQFERRDAGEPLLAENSVNSSLPVEKQQVRTFSSVDIDSLVPAATGERLFQFVSKDQPGKNPVLIPFQVKQLWLIPRGTTGKELEKILGTALRKNGKGWIFEKMTTRMNAVETVRSLGLRKYKLLTPVPPQPEDTRFIGTGKEKVQLHLTFLPEE